MNIIQLQLNFDQAKENLVQAAQSFETAASEFARGVAECAPSASSVIHQENEMLRQTVRRLVGVLRDQSGLPWHAAWVMTYHELCVATGYHPAAHGEQSSKKVFLDQVQADGKLEELLVTVQKMLTDKKYGAKN